MSVTTLAAQSQASTLAPRTKPAQRAIVVEVLRSFDEARAIWCNLSASGTATPYQGMEWLAAYMRHVDGQPGADIALVVVRDAANEPLMLIPLVVAAQGPVRIARFIGGKHSNFNAPVFAPNAQRLSEAEMRQALTEAGRLAGADLLALINQPESWEGSANPMALIHGQASPSAGYKFSLEDGADAVLHKQLSKDTRKKLRQKAGKLGQIGPVSYHKPGTPAEALMILDAFLALKAARFQGQGIDDPFAGEDVRRFLQEVVTIGLASGQGVLELHALMVGPRPVAIYGGVADRNRFSGVITAFDADPEIARSSPGDILLTYMVRDCCNRGLATFDLGVGEAHYKSKICDTAEPLFDTYFPVSLKGRVASLALSRAGALKRAIKQSPQGQKLIAAIRKLKARA